MASTISTAGVLEHIDPTVLLVEENVRTSAPIDKGFIDSIRENGVLMPLLAWRDQDGGVHVRAGQRRTLAAREAGTLTVPVYIVDAADDGEARRLVEQLIENDQREALTEGDRIEAWRQMELSGMSATSIARRTGTKRDRVKTGLAVATNSTTANLVTSVGLTLDQAAALLDFEDDPDTVANLTQVATENPDYFAVAVQRVRDERTAAANRARVEAEETAKGHRILTERPDYYSTSPVSIGSVTDADGKRISAEDIQGKDGVCVYVNSCYGGEARAEYFLDDAAALGLVIRESVMTAAAQSAPKGPMTDEQKAERKALIANNKEWDAASTVRREWLATFLSRKTLPKDATAVIAASLTHAYFPVSTSMGHGNALARELLAIEGHDRGALGAYLDAHPAKAVHVALAVVLGGIEDTTGRHSWRNPSDDVARYLRTLANWGHTLTLVEKIAAKLPVDEPTE